MQLTVLTELKDHVDSLLVINNEKLREMYGDQSVSTAFAKADDVLASAVKGITEIITEAGYINVDFADVETVMKDSGVAVMGTGLASGEERAIEAIRKQLIHPFSIQMILPVQKAYCLMLNQVLESMNLLWMSWER